MFSSRSLSLAALSLLLLSGTGCSQISSLISQKASDSLEGALNDAVAEAQAATTPADVAAAELPEQPSQASAITAAVEASTRAQTNAKSAVTRADWTQVDGDWQQAIAYLEAVPEGSPDYGEARTKLASYRTSQTAAAKNYLAADQARYTTLTTSPINDALKAGTFEADARQLRVWLHKGEFKKADQMLRSAISSNRRTAAGTYYADAVLMNAFAGNDVVYMPELINQLNKWVEAEPENAMAYAVRSYFTQAPIWPNLRIIRADAKDTEPDASSQQLVVSMLDAAVALALLSQLRMAKVISIWGEEQDESVFEEAFKVANAVMPNSFEVVQEKSLYLYLKDRSGQDALAYLRPLAAAAPANSALPMLIPVMHLYLGNDRGAADEYMQRPEVWAEIQKNAERVVAGLPETGLYAAWYARMATGSHHNEIASKYMQIAMNKGSESPMVQVWLRMMM
jgi:hypothetical protein